MQSQLTRILSSNIHCQLLSQLQTNQQQITNLQQILTNKNSQIAQLHNLINDQLQATITENIKLRDTIKKIMATVVKLRKDGDIMRELVQDFATEIIQMRGVWKWFGAGGKGVAGSRPVDSSRVSQVAKIQQFTQTQKQKQVQCTVSHSSNSQLLQRLQHLQQTILTLKQQKHSLQKSLKKYQTLYNTGSPQNQKQYNSQRAPIMSEQQKRQYIVKTFEAGFEGLEEKKYCGEMIGSRKNGRGVCEYLNGWVYEGGFVGGVRAGVGEIRYDGVVVYRGGWVEGRATGKGCLYYFIDPNIVKYSGFFKNGVIQGYGTVFFQNGQKIRGLFNKGQLVGASLLENQQGTRLQYGQINYQQQLKCLLPRAIFNSTLVN